MTLDEAIPLALRARSLEVEAVHSVLDMLLYDDEHPNRIAVYRRDIVAWLCDHPQTVYYDGARWALRVNRTTIAPHFIPVIEHIPGADVATQTGPA